MSYNKMMKQMKGRRLTFRAKTMHFGSDVLGDNGRRETPWLGGSWYEPGREADRAAFIAEWRAETERLLKINPNLKIVK